MGETVGETGSYSSGRGCVTSLLFGLRPNYVGASLVAQRLKRLPGMQETRVQSLGQEDPLEKEMATHSSCLENPHGQRSLVGSP